MLTIKIDTTNCGNIAGDLLKWIADQKYTIEVLTKSGSSIVGNDGVWVEASEEDEAILGQLIIDGQTIKGEDISVIGIP